MKRIDLDELVNNRICGTLYRCYDRLTGRTSYYCYWLIGTLDRILYRWTGYGIYRS